MLTIEQYQKYEQKIESVLATGKNAETGAAIPDDFESKLDITFEEHFAYQNAQARAHAAGTISTDVANVIYRALGESMSSKNGGWREGVTCARKVTITNLIGELLAATLAEKVEF